MTLTVEMIVLVGMAVVMGMLMRMLMGMGVTVVGMLMGMGMAVRMIMSAAKMIVMNMHNLLSFAVFLHYTPEPHGCQSIYFLNKSPKGACATAKYAV
jgi:hypothetical protein